MFYVYVISSVIRNYIYVGLSGNPLKRIKQHNDGHNKTTKPYKPFKTIFIESFNSRPEARNREKYLKSGNYNSKGFLKGIGLKSSVTMTFNEIPAPRPELVRQLADDAAFSECYHPFFHFAQLRVETRNDAGILN